MTFLCGGSLNNSHLTRASNQISGMCSWIHLAVPAHAAVRVMMQQVQMVIQRRQPSPSVQLRPAIKQRAASGTTCFSRQPHQDLHVFCRFELPPEAKLELETTHRHFYADKPAAARSLHPEQFTAPDRKHFIHAGEACLRQHTCWVFLRHSVNSRQQLMLLPSLAMAHIVSIPDENMMGFFAALKTWQFEHQPVQVP